MHIENIQEKKKYYIILIFDICMYIIFSYKY